MVLRDASASKNCIENVLLFPQSAVDYSLLFGVNSRSAIKKFLAAELIMANEHS